MGVIHHVWHVAMLRLHAWEWLYGRMSRSFHVHFSGIDVSSGAPLLHIVGAPNAIGSFVDVYIAFVLACLSAYDAGAASVLICHNVGVGVTCRCPLVCTCRHL
jgi:hypothetical protein